jgi:hypothetical protein
MRNYRESEVQMALCRYVQLKYPRSLFNCDLSGVNLSKTASGKAKMMRSGKGFPDFVLYESKGIYHGLFIELKAEGTKLCKNDGSPATPHIAEQSEMIDALNRKGYYAMFACGTDEAIVCIDYYMKM